MNGLWMLGSAASASLADDWQIKDPVSADTNDVFVVKKIRITPYACIFCCNSPFFSLA